MSPWLKISIALITGMIIRSLLYSVKYKQMSKFHQEYRKHIDAPSDYIPHHKAKIISLFKEAGVEDFTVGGAEHVGYGQIRTYNASGFANLLMINPDIVIPLNLKFKEAIGVFKRRALQSINPLFWIEFLIKLPQYLLKFVELEPQNLIGKIVQLIYWCIWIIVGLESLEIIDIVGRI